MPSAIIRRRLNWTRGLVISALGAGALGGAVAVQGCLDRPVVYVCPQSVRTFSTKVRATSVDKVDLLLVVDNSSSMADKQRQLEERVPELVSALTTPAAGQKGVKDIHVGVVTSSLGAQGSYVCDPSFKADGISNPPDMNDQGHLMPRSPVAAGGTGYLAGTSEPPPTQVCQAIAQNTALSWTYDATATPPGQYTGDTGATQLQAQVSCLVGSVNENGCGFEETWEGMYHFLIDPAPFQTATATCTYPAGGGTPNCSSIAINGLDNTIITERAAFLRPDSLLGVVIMSDENDFSLKPVTTNWLPWAWADPTGNTTPQLKRGYPECANVPDDVEPEDLGTLQALGCFSCYSVASSDPKCQTPWPAPADDVDSDQLNLRGFQQVQRYGVNFLWSRQRYVDAFTASSVLGSDGNMGANPIFAGGARTQDLIIVAGIVGVPKRLLEDSTGAPYSTLTEAQWDTLISPDLTVRDPHMIESIAPRKGLPMYNGTVTIDALGNANSDNGGERVVTLGQDLQYACIASRNGAPMDAQYPGCGTSTGQTQANNPVCGPPDSTGTATQPYFKGYPGLRHLRILHDLGSSGFAASICNNTYAPAIQGIISKIQAALNGQCISSVLTPAADGSVPCEVIQVLTDGSSSYQASAPKAGACEAASSALCTPGSANCNDPASPFSVTSTAAAAGKINVQIEAAPTAGATAVTSQVTATVDSAGNVVVQAVDSNNKPIGNPRLVCETIQLAGAVPAIAKYPDIATSSASSNACVTSSSYDATMDVGGGWCYSTDGDIIGAQCEASGAVGTIRFLGSAQPANGSDVFTICVSGSAASTNSATCSDQDAGTPATTSPTTTPTTTPTATPDAAAE